MSYFVFVHLDNSNNLARILLELFLEFHNFDLLKHQKSLKMDIHSLLVIDFGTTNTIMGYIDRKRKQNDLIQIAGENYLLPSYVEYSTINENVYVGNHAKNN